LDGIIFKDDARLDFTEIFLRGKGHTFFACDAPPAKLGFVVFPFKKGIDESAYNDEYFGGLGKKTIIFSGLRNAYADEECEKHRLAYHVIMEDRGVAIKNAVPTSEGVIAYLIANRNRTIADSRILITGYGVCGSDLARRLRLLGANVYALVRGREKACAARADSVAPVYMEGLWGLNFDICINTVPAPVLTDEFVGRANGALFVDIASKPGFNMELAKTYNNKSAALPGIPGKYAIKTAGEIIGEYIDFVLSGGK